jgi:hypothetical protein
MYERRSEQASQPPWRSSTKESYFLDLAAEEDWPKDQLRDKLAAIRTERKQVIHQLDGAGKQLDAGRAVFTAALDLLDNPAELYLRGNEQVRATLNKAFFVRLYVDGQKVTSQELAEPFDVLQEAYLVYRQRQAERHTGRTATAGPVYHRPRHGQALTAAVEADSDPVLLRLGSDWLPKENGADLLMEADAVDRSTFGRLLAVALAGHG